MAFPVSLASSLSISGTQPLSTYSHGTGVHVEDRNDIIALGRKLGLGTANAVASGTVALLGTGGTQSAWGQITNAYISGTAAIAVSKLGTVTASRPLVSNAGGTLVAGTITTDMIAANAVTSAPVSIAPGPQSTTASGTLVAMANGTVSFTTSAVNGPVWVFGRARLSSTASGAIVQYLYRGGTIFQELVVQILAAGESCPVGVVVQLPTLAASTTYEFTVYWYGPGGTTTWSDGVFSFVEFKK